MPRAPRIHYPGAVYHVMARGVDGREIFSDDEDRRSFIRTALGVESETNCSILAHCLMGNHFHFAIKVGVTPLSRIMQRLLTSYVLGFNARHDRDGHLFQARYKSCLCVDDAYLITLIRYIHQNPVRAGLVSAPGEWAWSSHRQYAKRIPGPLAAPKLYLDACGAHGEGDVDSHFEPWPAAGEIPPVPLGKPDRQESIDVIASGLFSADLAALKSGNRARVLSKKKAALAREALRYGHTLASIGGWKGCSAGAVHHLLLRNK